MLRARIRNVAGSTVTSRIALAAGLFAVLALAVLVKGPRAFSADQSLRITAPTPLATVTAPFTVSWQAPKVSGRQYGVFVDIPPISVGGSLRNLAGATCQAVKTCLPSDAQLSSEGVFVTASDQVTIPTLSVGASVGEQQKYPIHEITIVPLNSAGQRVGTAAWQVEFHAVKTSA